MQDDRPERESKTRSRQGAAASGPVIDTGLRPIFSKKSATALFVPMTEALDTTHVEQLRASFQLVGVTSKLQARMAYRMSHDGIVWSATVTGLDTVKTVDGWYHSDGTVVSLTTDQRRCVQLGMEVSNASGTQVEHALAQLVVQCRDLRGIHRRVRLVHQQLHLGQ